jgi:hypothetical protein
MNGKVKILNDGGWMDMEYDPTKRTDLDSSSIIGIQVTRPEEVIHKISGVVGLQVELQEGTQKSGHADNQGRIIFGSWRIDLRPPVFVYALCTLLARNHQFLPDHTRSR